MVIVVILVVAGVVVGVIVVVEELVSPTPFVDFVEMHCGLWEIGVFGP